MKILVTGGVGYIGSHATLCLLEDGHEVIVIDSLVNSSTESLRRVELLAGKRVDFLPIDLLDLASLNQVFAKNDIDAVVHFAGLKAVGESVQEPLRYYQNNIVGTLNLLHCMDEYDVRTLVFSSSATVYGAAEHMPLVEKLPLDAANPYGRTKEQIEDILSDLAASDPRWSIALLRYFNPIGAHESGLIGEDPQGQPNNLLPFVAQVAVGLRDEVKIFGCDYPTPDGTGIRDYIHVMDLVAGHLSALEHIHSRGGVYRWNLGTGRGASVLDVIATFGRAAGREIPYVLTDRRPGDVAISYADPSAALADLGWSASRDLKTMCEDHWRWQSNNPGGYPAPVL